MAPLTFALAAGVAGLTTCAALLVGLRRIVRLTSRLTALQVGGVTLLGLAALLVVVLVLVIGSPESTRPPLDAGPRAPSGTTG